MVDFKKTFVGYFSEQVKNAHFDSQLPPPPSKDSLRPSRAPRGTRTPNPDAIHGVRIPRHDPLPLDGAGWTRRAGRLIAALEDALARAEENPSMIAAIERAWFAYEMGGASDQEIARIAHVCERAHSALQGKMSGPIHDAYMACAHVLHAGLPTKIRKRVSESDVLEIVKEMRRTVDAWQAVVMATSRILDWDVHFREHAAQAVRTALDADTEAEMLKGKPR
jgi:hypothetical protein